MYKKIDFSNCPVDNTRFYGGANGNKIGIIYNNEVYMLKFSHRPRKNPERSYTNGCYSEHIACCIFNSLGIPAQQTLLGTYNGKTVVACKDFETNGFILKDFAHIKNSVFSNTSGYSVELSDILDAINEQTIIPADVLTTHFWDMFIADAFLGNFDRHNGNWGFLINRDTKEHIISPVYDCGSCLYPQANEALMNKILSTREELDKRLYTFPNSAISENNVKINYYRFLSTTDNIECLNSLVKISHKIDLDNINNIINATPYITDTHKNFLKTMIKERKENIIDKALERTAVKESNLERILNLPT